MIFPGNAAATGKIGEKLAAEYLRSQGYKILARNVRSAHGEIDIIAENREYLVFAEVKTRADNPEHFANYGRPAEAVNKQKQRHIIYTAEVFLQKHPIEKTVRFDVIEVLLGAKIRFNHIEDAFRL